MSYYPFNLYSEAKAKEKIDDLHANPVKACLVERAVDWQFGSARHRLLGKSVGPPKPAEGVGEKRTAFASHPQA